MTRRTVLIAILGVVLAAGAYVASQEYLAGVRRHAESAVAPAEVPSHVPYVAPARAWRFATEPEWVVHEVVRGLVSWTAFARGEDPTGTELKVRRLGPHDEAGVYEIVIRRGEGERRFALRPEGSHIWAPALYRPLAAELLGTAPADAKGALPDVSGLLLAADTASLRKADRLLFAALERQPGDGRLHREAALLWASHALRESHRGYGFSDDRPFLNGVTVHLALAGALLREDQSRPSLAAIVLDALLLRQTEAMSALDGASSGERSPLPQSWETALRLHVTHDPRPIPANSLTRLEKLEALRALNDSRTCRAALDQAAKWRLEPAADWTRPLHGCDTTEGWARATAHLPLAVADAAGLIDLGPSEHGTIAAAVRQAAANDHRPLRPTSVVPLYVRADAAARHLASGISLSMAMTGARAVPKELAALDAATRELRAELAQKPFLDLYLHNQLARTVGGRAAGPPVPAELCDALARVITDRPDLVPESQWLHVMSCSRHEALRMVRIPQDVDSFIALGTARMGPGPWRIGPKATDALPEAMRWAPWNVTLADEHLLRTYRGAPPPAEAVTAAYGKLMEYDANVIPRVVYSLGEGQEDLTEELGSRACAIDVNTCGQYGGYLYSIGRDAGAEKLFQRMLAGPTDSIATANAVSAYVNMLLDRGDVDRATSLARGAAGVYSAMGLFSLALVHERLGRFEDAAEVYRRIVERYPNSRLSDRFYVRYTQRHGPGRFDAESATALARVFPNGLVRKSLAEFQRDSHRGGVPMDQGQLDVKLRRAGLQRDDFVIGVDGFVVTTPDQMDAVLTFTDDPNLHVVVMRKGTGTPHGFIEVTGTYRRWRYGRVARAGAPGV